MRRYVGLSIVGVLLLSGSVMAEVVDPTPERPDSGDVRPSGNPPTPTFHMPIPGGDIKSHPPEGLPDLSDWVAPPHLPTAPTVETSPEAPPEPVDVDVHNTELETKSSSIVVRICIDLNENRACDIDEGVKGMTAYVLDVGSGAILGQATTERSGAVTIPVMVLRDADLAVNVPFIYAYQPVYTSDSVQIVVDHDAALPGALP